MHALAAGCCSRAQRLFLFVCVDVCVCVVCVVWSSLDFDFNFVVAALSSGWKTLLPNPSAHTHDLLMALYVFVQSPHHSHS